MGVLCTAAPAALTRSVSVPRYRGWLVRRLCCFLAVWDWKVPADTPRDLPERVCRSHRSVGTAGGFGVTPPWDPGPAETLSSCRGCSVFGLWLLLLRGAG